MTQRKEEKLEDIKSLIKEGYGRPPVDSNMLVECFSDLDSPEAIIATAGSIAEAVMQMGAQCARIKAGMLMIGRDELNIKELISFEVKYLLSEEEEVGALQVRTEITGTEDPITNAMISAVSTLIKREAEKEGFEHDEE